jgi:type VI secretion system FHA domain protein
MSLTLKIISDNRRALGERADKTFGQAGGTIGRSLEADWSLPDGQRFLSSKHASIDFRSGCYYIVDTSKNGVYVNGAEKPVGHGKPQRLFSGDKIRIGEYTMEVSIASVDDTRETLLDTGHVDPVDRKQRVEAPDPTGLDLIDAQTVTGVGIEIFLEDDDAETLKPLYEKYGTADSSRSLKLVDEPKAPTPAPAKSPAPAALKPAPQPAKVSKPAAPKPAPAPAVSKQPAARPAPAPAASRAPVPPPAPARPAPKPAAAAPTPIRKPAPIGAAEPAASRNPLDAFFKGAGIAAPAMNPRQAEQFMTQLGQVTRELIVGVIDGLHLRALQKAQLKQSNTTIQKLDNNRLKFAANVEEGFAKLFSEESDQYQSPVESVRNAYADLKHHQRALLAATRRALDEYLDRLEPAQIENRAGGGIGGALLNAANKFKYWDLYKDVYGILANRATDEMPQAFLDELATAYADEIAKHAPKSEAGSASKEAG